MAQIHLNFPVSGVRHPAERNTRCCKTQKSKLTHLFPKTVLPCDMIIRIMIDPAAKAQRIKKNYYLTILIHPAIS